MSSTSKKLAHITQCEICGLDEPKALERHHIIPTTDKNSTDFEDNLAVICGSCHNLVHSNMIVIEGRFLTTSGYKLFWHKFGDSHIIIPGVHLNADGSATVKWS